MDTSEHKTWTVVKFMSDDSVSVVPTNWIHDENTCYWPPFASAKITSAIKTRMINTCWPSHQISVFRNATYESYEVARLKARKAEETSDLNTEDDDQETNKKRRRMKRFSSSEDSDDDNLYVKPPPKLDRPGSGIFSKKNKNEEKIDNKTKNKILPGENIPVLCNINAIPRTPGSETDKGLMDCTILNDRNTHTPISSSSSSIILPNLGSATNPNPTCSENSCQCCPHLKQYFREILKQQHIIRTRLNDLSQMVEQNISRPTSTETEDEAFTNFNLPLDSVDRFKEFNIFLKNPQEFSKGVTQMSKMGGSNTYDFAKRVLQSVITNDLASLYSWWGRREKFKFCDLPFAQLVIAAAEKNGKAPDKKIIEEAVSSWLRRAKERKTRSVK